MAEITKQQLDVYVKAYNQGKPLISDEEYDVLLEEYLRKHGEDKRPFLRQQQSSYVNDIVGTLPKVYGVRTPMREGQRTYQDIAKKKGFDQGGLISIQPKFDGVSVALDCHTGRFFTRGDYDNGESVDVTELFEERLKVDSEYFPSDTVGNLAWMLDGFDSVKFEAIMHPDVFKQLGLDSYYARPRDAVQGNISSRNWKIVQHIILVPLRYYKAGNQLLTPFLGDRLSEWDNYEFIESFIYEILTAGAISVSSLTEGLQVDGVVVSVTEKTDTAGSVSMKLIPDKEIAIKILNLRKATKLLNVQYQFGKSGRITPVAIVEPVKFDNITVDHISLSNMDRIVKLGLKYGDTVEVMYNIVPYLVSTKRDGDFPVQLPEKCPYCGSPLDLSTLSIVRCTNPDCCMLKFGAIVRYVEKMKMFGVSGGILKHLYDAGYVQSIPDLYRLRVENIESLEGFGRKSAENIISSIKKSSQGVPLHKWLGAFPMDDIAEKTWLAFIRHWKIKLQHPPIDTIWFIFDLLRNPYMNVPGIRDVTMGKMCIGMERNISDMRQILPNITLVDSYKEDSTNKERITLTGTRDAGLTEHLESLGYEVDSFSIATKAVVVPYKNFKSSKVDKANKLGIPIYTIDEAYEHFN